LGELLGCRLHRVLADLEEHVDDPSGGADLVAVDDEGDVAAPAEPAPS
jgi:hypothetical protein